MAHPNVSGILAAANAALLVGFNHHLLGRNVAFRIRRPLLETARRFLLWLEDADAVDGQGRLNAGDEATTSVRERFLIADCADRESRHDVRAEVNQFLRFVSIDRKRPADRHAASAQA